MIQGHTAPCEGKVVFYGFFFEGEVAKSVVFIVVEDISLLVCDMRKLKSIYGTFSINFQAHCMHNGST